MVNKTNATNPLHQSTKVKPGNKFINNYGWLPRQKLGEDLIIQAIKMNGMYMHYIPREMFERDPLFGDDNFAQFNYSFELEFYIKSVDSYEGQNEIFGNWGLELKDQITFTISRRRWKESNEHKLLDEQGLPIEDESSPTWRPYETATLTEENGPGGDYNVQYPLPRAGDLVYFPMVDKLFEILFVEHENLFHPLGILLTYDLKCELFRYNNEKFETGNADIDAFNNLLSTSQDEYNVEDEDTENPIQDESGDELTEENDAVDDKDAQADNKFLENSADDLIDYTDQSPYIRRGKY